MKDDHLNKSLVNQGARLQDLTKSVNPQSLCKMNMVSEEFIGEHIISKAKIYDFLPIAYN